MQYLIKITDGTLVAAIVLSFLLFLIFRTAEGGKTRLAPGVLPGVGAALVYAVLKRNTGFAVREYYDLGVMLPSMVFSLLFLALVWQGFAPKSATVRKGFRFVLFVLTNLVLAYCLPDILLSPFEFAVGMESIYNTDFLYRAVGYAAALATMFLLGLAVYKMAEKTSGRYLLVLAFAAGVIFFLQQSLEVVQILAGRNLIPRPRWLMSLLITLLSYRNGFAYAFMILLASWATALVVRVRLTPLTGANPAQIRLMKADHRRQLRVCGLLTVCLAVSLLTVTVLRSHANREVEISPPVDVAAQEGGVNIALEEVNDGNLHRYQFTASGGTAVRFIIIKKNESAYGVGLDACDICGPTG
ncbi:MAG: Fe-S-containing protein, partial [Candidatus Accumulibacter sp.]|nr:Fe-S-containing protein [Accumulibacter sp.]